MKKVDECVICKSKKLSGYPTQVYPFVADRIWNSKPFKVYFTRCNACGFEFYNPRPDDKELAILYHNYRGDAYQKQREHYEPTYTKEKNAVIGKCATELECRKSNTFKILSECIDVDKIKSVIDWGGDMGQFIIDELENAERYVYDISGVTPIKGVMAYDKNNKRTFDLIMCCFVLEHVQYPLEVLKQIKMVSHKDSIFYFEVPLDSQFDIPSSTTHGWHKYILKRVVLPNTLLYNMYYFFNVLTKSFDTRSMHEHLNYFSIKSMSNMLESNGFKILFMDKKMMDFGWDKCNVLSCLAKLASEKV